MEQRINHQKILVVDDERGIREGLARSLQGLGYEVVSAESGEEALYHLNQKEDFSFVLTDYKMRGLDGFDVLKEFKKKSPQTPVVVMTGFGDVSHAVNAMQMGANDYLCKPFRFQDLEKIILKSIPEESEMALDRILTQDESFRKLLSTARRAAKSSAPILIEGPSGTGKELLARQIHDWSERRNKPWVAINCAALPSGLLESELFGYEKGAFTGAVEKKMGRFEQAHEGTLLLDEIGELDPILQAKLLRVLQEGEVDRLGGKKPQSVDVRVVATTNRDLRELVEQGRFREDLYFRLYGVRFEMPALRERKEDIPLLAKTFLTRVALDQGRDLQFEEDLLKSLQDYDWPGNIRELERAVERAAILSENGLIELSHFQFSQTKKTSSPMTNSHFASAQTGEGKSMRDLEKDIILNSLQEHGGNRTHTAKALGMSLRTLRHKLKVYRDQGIDVDGDRQSSQSKTCRSFVFNAPPAPEGSASKFW